MQSLFVPLSLLPHLWSYFFYISNLTDQRLVLASTRALKQSLRCWKWTSMQLWDSWDPHYWFLEELLSSVVYISSFLRLRTPSREEDQDTSQTALDNLFLIRCFLLSSVLFFLLLAFCFSLWASSDDVKINIASDVPFLYLALELNAIFISFCQSAKDSRHQTLILICSSF